MIPGLTSKLSETRISSATTIVAASDLVIITDPAIPIVNIIPNYAGFSGLVFFVGTSAANGVQFNVGGNIAKAALTVQFQLLTMVYSKSTGLWYPGPIS